MRDWFDPTTGVIGRVLRTGQPELVLEPERDGEFVQAVSGVCAQVCVPILAEGRVLGVLSAESTTPGQFGPGDVELLGALGRQMAVALENTRLYRAAQAELHERSRAEAKYRSLFEESKDALFIVTPEGRILDTNPAGVELFGYQTREQLLQVPAVQLWVNPDDRAAFARQLARDGYAKDFPLQAQTRDGRRLSVLETATVERDTAGHIIAYRGIIRDVTEREQRLARARAETARREAILRAARRFAQQRDSAAVVHELLGEAVGLVGADDGGIARWDRARQTLIQVASFLPSDRDGTDLALETTASGQAAMRRTPVLANDYQSAFGTTSPAGRLGAQAVLAVPLQHEGQLVGTLSVSRLRAGAPFVPEELEALELLASFATATLVGLERTQALRQQAERDSLTGLANRHAGAAALERLLRLSERQGQPMAVAVLDVDHFKAVNDAHGHPAGDAVLRRLGEVLRTSFRGEDVVARWGGEEFVVGALGASQAEALHRIDALREQVGAELFNGADGTRFSLTISAGVATAPLHARTVPGLYAAADAALYRAKARGRNQVVAATGLDDLAA